MERIMFLEEKGVEKIEVPLLNKSPFHLVRGVKSIQRWLKDDIVNTRFLVPSEREEDLYYAIELRSKRKVLEQVHPDCVGEPKGPKDNLVPYCSCPSFHFNNNPYDYVKVHRCKHIYEFLDKLHPNTRRYIKDGIRSVGLRPE